MFMPLWFTTVDGASKTSGGSARTRSCSLSSVPCVIRWGSYATPLTVLMLAQDLAPEDFSLKFVFTIVHFPPACSHEACVMYLATHSALGLLRGGILGQGLFPGWLFPTIHNPDGKQKNAISLTGTVMVFSYKRQLTLVAIVRTVEVLFHHSFCSSVTDHDSNVLPGGGAPVGIVITFLWHFQSPSLAICVLSGVNCTVTV